MIEKLLAEYCRDLITFTGNIAVGRHNFDRAATPTDFIIIDSLGPSSPSGRTYGYDGDAEQETFSAHVRGDFTLDFYGATAETNAYKFVALQGSQKSYELQRDLGFSVGHCGQIANLRSLDGAQYNGRYQVQLILNYQTSAVVDTLRIDEAVVDIIYE